MSQRLSPARAQSFGKLILIGEHAVVYGAPAIAAGISLGAHASAQAVSGPSWLQLGEQRVFEAGDTETARAFSALLAALRGEPAPQLEHEHPSIGLPAGVGVEVELDLPAGVGLGASAAIAVAIAKACAGLRDAAPAQTAPAVLRAANAWEAIFHGNPSGVDVAAALAGSPIWFVRHQPPLPIECPLGLELAVGLAGPPASTSRMVHGVSELRRAEPARVSGLIAEISDLATAARAALGAGDLTALGRAMSQNHVALRQLGVSTDALDRACELAQRAGALGAKLTGAGGGGAVVALCAGSPDAILESWLSAGIQCFATQVAARAPSAPHVPSSGAQDEDT